MRSRRPTGTSRSRSSRPCVPPPCGWAPARCRKRSRCWRVWRGAIRSSPAAWQQLGDAAADAGRIDQAADAYRRAAALRPNLPDPHLDAARALLRLRRLDEAGAAGGACARRGRRGPETARVRSRTARTDCPRAARFARCPRSMPSLLARSIPRRRCRRSSRDGCTTTQANWTTRFDRSERAAAELEKSGGQPIADLHYHAGDTLIRLERTAEAEPHLLQELARFPAQRSSESGAGGSLQRVRALRGSR